MMLLRPWALALSTAAFLLAGCTVGPNYHRPDAATAPAWKENAVPPPNPPNGTWKQAEPSDGVLRGAWWEMYADPQLNALEAKVAVSNQTLRVAMEQYFSAREQVRVARSQYYPTFAAGPSVQRTRESYNQANTNRAVTDLPVQHDPARRAGAVGTGSLGTGAAHRGTGARQRTGIGSAAGECGAEPAL